MYAPPVNGILVLSIALARDESKVSIENFINSAN
jgi:hypothetical protein